jgi:hypothetical protein
MSFINLLEQELKALEESSLSRLQSKVSAFESGAITAFRGERDLATNKANNRKLKAYLMQRGYSVTAVKGSYIENFGSENQREVSEPSFFVSDHQGIGNLEQTLTALGRMFDQDSVLIVPKGGKDAYLIGTSQRPDAWPSYGKREIVGSSKFGKVAGQFLSRVKNREFAFESVKFPDTINGKRGWHMLAESVQK